MARSSKCRNGPLVPVPVPDDARSIQDRTVPTEIEVPITDFIGRFGDGNGNGNGYGPRQGKGLVCFRRFSGAQGLIAAAHLVRPIDRDDPGKEHVPNCETDLPPTERQELGQNPPPTRLSRKLVPDLFDKV